MTIMDRIRLWVIKIFKINTFEGEYVALMSRYNDIQRDYNMAQNIIESYRRDYTTLENKCETMIKDTEAVLALYESPDRVKETYEHRAYAAGRRDAYAEMGIKALNKRLMNESLYLDHNDNEITEEEYKRLEEFCKLNEIDIDDLEDVEAREDVE